MGRNVQILDNSEPRKRIGRNRNRHGVPRKFCAHALHFRRGNKQSRTGHKVRKALNRAKRELAYYRALFSHARTPRISRWLLGGATAYLLSPLDIIPDFIPILGQLDDLVIVPCMIYAALAFIPASVKAECREKTAGV